MTSSCDSVKPFSRLRSGRSIRRIPAILILAFLSFRFFQLHRFKAPQEIHAASLQLVNLNGSAMDPSVLRGRAVILNYWAPWCPPCRLETPWLQKLQELHPERLVVVGVVADPGQYKEAQAFMRLRGITYPLARETSSLDSVVGAVAGLPTTFYISASGRVLHTTTGLTPEVLMKRYANDALRD